MRCIVGAILVAAACGAAADDAALPVPSKPAPQGSAETSLPTLAEQPLAIQEATRIGIALGAAQRCGMAAQDADTLTKLGYARLQLVAKDKALYGKAASVMHEAQSYASTQMKQPKGGCAVVLPMASGILGNLTYLIARAEPDVPQLNRSSPLENFAAWSGQLAVMASNCGAQDELVNRGVNLSSRYIDQQAKDQRSKDLAAAELSQMMLQAVFERWGDPSQCVKILTEFGMFFGNLDARLPKQEAAGASPAPTPPVQR
jgi:hypothetical protein